MITYTTLDYLSAFIPTATERSAAPTLTFSPSSFTFSSLGYENQAITFESGTGAILRDLFRVNLTEGASYYVYSSSFFDPFILSLHDTDGRFVAVDSGTSYGNDTLSYKAPYTGIYYINASWDQGLASAHKFVYLSIYEDLDTAKIPSTVNAGITGTTGNDKFFSLPSSEAINGLAGIDTVVYSNLKSNFTLVKGNANGNTTFTVQDKTGVRATDILTAVERLSFADTNVALDMDGNAGQVAKILGAVFGASAVFNKSYVGIGLNYLDGGMSFVNLTQLAIDARLGGRSSNADVVNLLYKNVVGITPDSGTLAYYKGLLDNGNFTQGSLGALAANTLENMAQVNLVGLSQTGLEFTYGT